MRDNNNHKSDPVCAFGETLVAVLYNEATPSETAEFESHLKNCRECGKELAAFGTFRSAVTEWREAEFARLVSPKIVLPDDFQTIETAAPEKLSLLQSFRGFFSTANFGWQTAAAGFAAFVILGLLFFGSTNLFKPPVEEAKTALPAVVSTPEIAAVPKSEPPLNETTAAQNEPPANASALIGENTRRASTRINRKAVKKSDSLTAGKQNLPKRSNPVRKIETQIEDLAVLPVADAEDDSLRLTDLLEEIEPSS